MSDRGEFREVVIDENQILVLDGKVVEYFKKDQPATEGGWRFHVDHIAVEGKPRDDGGLKLKIGRERFDEVWAQATAEVPPESVDAVMEFFEAAKRERS